MEDTCSNQCVFCDILVSCSINKKYGTKELSATQKGTLDRCSEERQDGFYDKFLTDLDKCIHHTDCYSTYTRRASRIYLGQGGKGGKL